MRQSSSIRAAGCSTAAPDVREVGVRVVPVEPGRVMRLMIAAARLPARKLPANSQFERPMAIGRIWFSTQLLSHGTAPSSR